MRLGPLARTLWTIGEEGNGTERVDRKRERCSLGEPDGEHIVVRFDPHRCRQPDVSVEHLAALHEYADGKAVAHVRSP
jgi:hypothetical protein